VVVGAQGEPSGDRLQAEEAALLTPLFLNLGQHDILSDGEKAILTEAIVETHEFPAGTEHVAGDFVDLHAFLLKTMDHGITALSRCRVGYAKHGDLKKITEKAPHLARLLWLDTLVDGAIHREWIVAMGRRSRKSHLAHLICELFVRLEGVGRTTGPSFHFPLSQAEMADVLGLSAVHMNRVIQNLRREGLISWVNQTITILDWDKIREVAEFDPTYLSMVKEPR
jgi:CRP-like cAMP-binding protein